jgi:Multicopper oxidase
MVTIDMLADNPGTWMFHCHVEDHMENGMMAVYTIYAPPARPCPLTFTGGDFWKHAENFTLTVKNVSAKPILPGEEQTLERPGIRAANAQAVLGWVFFPASVKYADGTTWHAQSEGECFSVLWREQQHPDLPVLPPRQIEMNSD